MKRYFFLKNVCIIASLFCFAMPSFSQYQGEVQSERIQKFILDAKIRYGQLDNGLTYYIRHNEMPRERAEFYIVHNVGSMQEEENQRGLAHFLEHMAFNGSKNFPAKKGIQDFTENIGMSMGENVNAYTGFDETVYMLMNAPVTREEIIDSCLLILHDWSSFLLLDEEAIEKERGVIREEWRTSQTAQMRLWQQQLPKMFPDNKYGTRLPIGDINIIEKFKRNELVAYYKKWYRPDLQAIIVVGDVDVDKIEGKIKTMFSDIPKSENTEKKEFYLVSDNDRPLVTIAKDKEMTNTVLTLYYKHELDPFQFRGTLVEFITDYTHAVVSLIMRERFSEIVQKANPPFLAAQASDGDYFVSKTKGAWTTMAYVKSNEIERAMRALVAETERVKKFGFTESEYERAREQILKYYESYYNERDNQENGSLAERCINHFTNHSYMPGIEIEYEIIKTLAPQFPLEGINTFVRNMFNEANSLSNIVLSLVGPDTENIKYPTEQELLVMFMRAILEPVEENEDEEVSKILIPELPEPGKIIREQEDDLFGTTLYTLSNGVRVVVKQTDFKNDEIQMNALSPGGITVLKDEKDIWNVRMMNEAIMLGGLGDFSATRIQKAIAGKNVSCSIGLTSSYERLDGSASPSDLRTLFEIIYLQFTALRTDEDAFSSFRDYKKENFDNESFDPMTHFSDTMNLLAYDDNPRTNRLKSADFEKIDYHRMIEMYRERFADASDFIFTFVGNVDKDSIRPLMEQYLATLPSLNRKDEPDEKQYPTIHKGKIKKHFSKQLETPQSTIGLMYSGEMPFHLRNVVTAQLLNYIFDLTFAEKIREDESGSYGIQTYVDLYDFPQGMTKIEIYFDTAPELQDTLLEITKSAIQQIADEGPKESHLFRSRESAKRRRVEIMRENDYWLNNISAYYVRNFDAHTEYDTILNSITAEEIKSFLKTLLEQGNEIEVVMYPTTE